MSSRTPRATLVAIDARDGARRCVMTATEGDRVVPQHRQGGMGGRPDKHRPENVVWADSILNGLIEADAALQDAAKAHGVKIPIWVRNVTLVPVYFQFERTWFVLEGVTRRAVTEAESLGMMLDVYGDEYLKWAANADLLRLRGRA
jgi:hypothetical protein